MRLLLILILITTTFGAEWPDSSKVNFCLPHTIIAKVGTPVSIYFEGVTLNKNLSKFHFLVICEKGLVDSLTWSYNPIISDTGSYAFKISAYDEMARLVETDSSILIVSKDTFAKNDTTKILMIGNSLTRAGQIAQYLTQLVQTTGSTFKTMGSISINDSIKVEGWSGKTWSWFLSDSTSPMVFRNNSVYNFDYLSYIQKYCPTSPNIVTIELGINDCFYLSIDTCSLTIIDSRINAVFVTAQKMIKKIKEVTPNVKIGVCLLPTPSMRDSVFYKNYPNSNITRWGWKKVQYRLNQRYLNEFANSLGGGYI